MKVDVVILTKNCANPIFEKCLSRVKAEVPVNRLIVVDGFSTDNTLQIVNRFFPNATVVFDRGTRATARQKGIEMVETEWFAFIDSDVIINEDWFTHLTSLIDSNIGLIIGKETPIYEVELRQLEDALTKMKRKIGFRGTVFPFRAFMGDTLILTKAVKKIKIPSILHVYEDSYIQQHIEKQGYKWKVTPEPVALHYGEIYRKSDLVWAGSLGFLLNFLSFKRMLLAVLLVIPKGILVMLMKKNPQLFQWLLFRWFTSFVGVLKAITLYGFKFRFPQPKLTLDIGCGGTQRYLARPRGTINCDIQLPEVKIPNFIRCDAHHLPFKNKCFTQVTGIQLLEHCKEPRQVAQEMLRVCNKKIIIAVPSPLSPDQHNDENHIRAFTPYSFRNLFKGYKVKVRRDYGTCIEANNVWIRRIGKVLSYVEPLFARSMRVEIEVA